MKKLICLSVVVLAISAVAYADTYEDGSCTGTMSITFSNATFTAGQGWSTGSGRSISWSGYCSGCSWGPGVYGWWRNPLVEYYIGKSGGSSQGSYSCDGTNYTLYVDRRYGQPSIDGTADFDQLNASGSRTGTKDMGCHFNAWSNMGNGPGSHSYQIVSLEGFSGNSGSGEVTVSGANWFQHWNNGGSSDVTCGGGGGSTTTTSGGSTTTTSGGGTPYRLRASGTSGDEEVNLRIGGDTIATFNLSTSMSDYTASSYNSGTPNVQFYNDSSGRDVQVDYLSVDGDYRQAEDMASNTAVWQDGSCGGSYSEWMHCNGVIEFPSGGGGSTTTTSSSTTTTSGGSTSTTTTSGGGGTPYRLRASGTSGDEEVNLRIGGNTIATFNLSTSMSDYTASSYSTGGIDVQFYNDSSGRDVQIDYLSVDGDYRQAEDQSTNTGVWQDDSCGGSYSEWLHCNGYIGFGDTPGGGGSTTTTSGGSTTTTASSWWGGWW